ncbi:hypothetical protein BGZ76_010544 [Entomortierella beljakovae]|nr:hypothetical protein BGZ76_010544 [Entomortierella beljakovae]
MSQRKGASNSKFGHLFGDSGDNSTSSTSQSRLSGSGDLYRDPLATLVPPVTATTTTTRGGTTVKATLSPPPSTTSASTVINAASTRSSPPGSGSSSRSSSRLQHHALFSSLTSSESGGSSLFDSVGPASSTLSPTKRDLLFGEGSPSSGTTKRVSTPPLTKGTNANTSGTVSEPQQSSRVPTPPLGNSRLASTALEAEASPLGLFLGNSGAGSKSQGKEDSIFSTKSPPPRTEPLTRTSSQTSAKSHGSVKSSRSILSQNTFEPIATGTIASTSFITGPLSSSSTHSTTDPIINPLTSASRPSTENPISRSSSVSSLTSQSIETFQAISRSSSPNAGGVNVVIPYPPMSKSGFERENNMSPPPISKSRMPIDVGILDDAADAFAKDFLFSSGPSESAVASTTSNLRSSSFLDTGFSHTVASSSNAPNISNTSKTSAKSTSSTGSYSNPKSGFSLGEDVADSSNPWMNPLTDSLSRANLTPSKSSKIDYTQSDASEQSFLPDDVTYRISSGDASLSNPKGVAKSISQPKPTLTTLPSLEDDIGGFDDVFSSSKLTSVSSSVSLFPPELSGLPTLSSSPQISTSSRNVLEAAEAAANDPDFMGPNAPANRSSEKVLAMMQMPKIAMEKDVSAQEVFDNPWQ